MQVQDSVVLPVRMGLTVAMERKVAQEVAMEEHVRLAAETQAETEELEAKVVEG